MIFAEDFLKTLPNSPPRQKFENTSQPIIDWDMSQATRSKVFYTYFPTIEDFIAYKKKMKETHDWIAEHFDEILKNNHK